MSREHVVSRVPVVIIHVVIFVNVRLTVVSRALHNVDSFEGPYLVPSMGAVLRCGAIFVEMVLRWRYTFL